MSKKEKHEDKAPTKSGKETTEKRPKVDQASPAHGRQHRAGSDTSVPMPRADKDGEIKQPGAEQGTRSHLLAGRKERCGRLWQCCLGRWKARATMQLSRAVSSPLSEKYAQRAFRFPALKLGGSRTTREMTAKSHFLLQ